MIKVKSGHLTATNKRVISEMLKMSMMEAQSGKIVYRISSEGDGDYKVEISKMEMDDYGRPVNRIWRPTFSYSAA